MPSRVPGFVPVALLAVLSACGESQPFGAAKDPYVEAIVAKGYRRDMIVDRGDYFIVEGDIEIPKRDLLLTDGPRPAFQWRTNNLVGSSAVQNIVVDLSGLEASWQTAMRAAMAEWSKPAMLSNLMFTEGSPGNMTAIMENLGGSCGAGLVALAKPPSSSGNAGDTIRVSPVFTNCYDASQKKYVLAHELGHTIGFRHTNWQALGECGTCNPPVGAIQVAGTPATDASSVMNGNTGGTSWSAFSSYDRLAVRALYPPPAFIVATTTYPGTTTLVTFPNPPLPDGPTEYRVRLTVSGWQNYEGEQYGMSYEDFASPWSSSTEVTLTGFSYTGNWYCSYGDPWVHGSWYREHAMWLGVRYSDGFEYELPLIDAPFVMVCP